MTAVINGIEGKFLDQFYRYKQVVKVIDAQDHAQDKQRVITLNVKTSEHYVK